MLDNEKILNNSISDDELGDIAGGSIPKEIFSHMTTAERAMENIISVSNNDLGKPCVTNTGFVWTQELYDEYYKKYVTRD